jgi:pyruvate dehydrogenase E1 component
MWAAADQLAHGFLIGGTAGKTTLTGEGLQHMDGHSPLLAATNSAVHHYDPAYAYEIGYIIEDGIRRMYGDNPENIIYYLTVYNEPMIQPAEPPNLDVEGLLKGMYHYKEADTSGANKGTPRVQLMASGVGMPWALEAQELLKNDFGILADVWSVTSWNELRREAEEAEALSMHGQPERVPFIKQRLQGIQGPFIAVSDFIRGVPDQIAPWMSEDFATLGADGFGFSDTRAAARRWLKIDGPSIAVKALQMLAKQGRVDASLAQQAFDKYDLNNTNAGSSGEHGGDA